MRQCGHHSGPKKPRLQDSAAKATEIIASDPELSAMAVAEAVFPKPWEDVSEEELVELIRPFYSTNQLSAADRRKHVRHRVIEPKYGRFEFGKFGFGTFEKFLVRHGFEEEGHLDTYEAGSFPSLAMVGQADILACCIMISQMQHHDQSEFCCCWRQNVLCPTDK